MLGQAHVEQDFYATPYIRPSWDYPTLPDPVPAEEFEYKRWKAAKDKVAGYREQAKKAASEQEAKLEVHTSRGREEAKYQPAHASSPTSSVGRSEEAFDGDDQDYPDAMRRLSMDDDPLFDGEQPSSMREDTDELPPDGAE